MSIIPKTKDKIKLRIKHYEQVLKKEKREFGNIDDGSGKRYLLGILYLLSGDNDGALKHFEWFEKEFSDDIGEPGQYIAWTLTLLRTGKYKDAKNKLLQTILMNLYLVPRLIEFEQVELAIWYGSNIEEKSYIEYIPSEIFDIWNIEEKRWALEIYNSEPVQIIRNRYIVLSLELKDTHDIESRRKILRQIRELGVYDLSLQLH